jgi:DNA-binding response OmpR family regulator
MRVLVVEDEPVLAEALHRMLRDVGYLVDGAADGDEALEYARAYHYDVVILDAMLPRRDGFVTLGDLRRLRCDSAVLMLTARSDLDSKVRGLDLGADDYLTKPFERQELLARIRALLRRPAQDRSGVLKAGDLTLDPAARDVSRGGARIRLTAREYQLLEFLLRNKNRVQSRERIFEHVWSEDYVGSLKIVDVYVTYLRRKVDEGRNVKLIHTLRGHGYVLKEPT